MKDTSNQIILLACNAAVGGFLFGYDTASMSAALLQLKRPSVGTGNVCPGLETAPLTVPEQEMVVAFVLLGAFIGAILASQMNYYFGRRMVLLCSAVVFAAGAVFMSTASNLMQMLISRIVLGLAVGTSSHTVPLYISECSPSGIRGSMCFLNDLCIVVGQASAALVSIAFFNYEVEGGWRWILGVAAFPAVVMLLGFAMQPESPRWLLSKNRRDEALKSLQTLRGADGMESSVAVQQEFEDMISDVALEEDSRTEGGSVISYFKDAHIKRALMLGCGLAALQQWCGINTIMYYGASVLEQAGPPLDVRSGTCFTAENKRNVTTTFFFAAAQMSGVVFSWFLVDRVGRRPLILTSLTGVMISLLCVGTVFHSSTVSHVGVVVFVVAYLVSFGLGVSPVPWTVNAEIYPLHARANCISMSTATHWLMNFTVAATFLSAEGALSTHGSPNHPDGIFWLYSLVAALGLGLLWTYMPETKDVKLEQMRKLFVDPEEKPLM